ncbi:hypothetical protein DI09_93p100 [Mitosporidium daphniae]|uniref:Rho-GAP domain-containing protein n=1 Tax=Mitosporidium daphniae TaxID=1485682 RepID=A0A098VMJ3_9MICR|nr:uncharacterized protein DI09_93p100 [Mitosporidium daphniae]KGG50024.1 hypothetical protein DI09_93p100 [Mitosporidium daphniae]|eukprot:XP_013236460.1 uncharacterized protein DI09_93p100 [Mitosporidium daphniae]
MNLPVKVARRIFQKELEKLLSGESSVKSLSRKLETVESKFSSISPKVTIGPEEKNRLSDSVSSFGSIKSYKTTKSRISLFFGPKKEFELLKDKLSTLTLKHSEHYKKVNFEKESFVDKQFPALIKKMGNISEELSFLSLRELYSSIDISSQTHCSLLELCVVGIDLAPLVSRIINSIEQLGGLTTFNLYGTGKDLSCENVDEPILSNLSQLLKRALMDFYPRKIFIASFFDKIHSAMSNLTKQDNTFKMIKATIGDTVKLEYTLISTLFLHLHRVSRNSMTNGSSSLELALIFFPLLAEIQEEKNSAIKAGDPRIEVIQFIIEEAEKIFCN